MQNNPNFFRYRPELLVDPLSDVLSILRPKTFVSAGLDAGGEWALDFPRHEGIKFNAVLKGSGWVKVAGTPEWQRVRPNDCVLLTHGLPFIAASDPSIAPVAATSVYENADRGMATYNGGGHFVLIGTRFLFEGDHIGLLFGSLPPIMIIQGESQQAAALRWALTQLSQELHEPRPAARLMSEHLGQIMLLQMLRLWLTSEGARPTGLLGALAEPRLAEAIGAIHTEPTRSWRLAELASVAGMSRTTFAQRFHQAVGTPPLEYLTRWRMWLAADRLSQTGEAIGRIGFGVGYSSEAAFSTAFRRVMGCSPLHYRRKSAGGLVASRPGSNRSTEKERRERTLQLRVDGPAGRT